MQGRDKQDSARLIIQITNCRKSMSSKARNKQSEPRRIPQLEAIITRHKSAQLKRQLRNKQDTITKINQMTQLLKSSGSSKSEQKSPSLSVQKTQHTSPTATKTKNVTKSSPKKVKNLQKKHEKRKNKDSENIDSKEFYPNMLKRKVEAKKVLLKPKHDLKLIGRTKIDKRKLAVPQKGIKSQTLSKRTRSDQSPPISPQSTKSGSPVHSELSIEEMVRLTDESESLNDEDWLEILTCPSPVWWEEPPDAQYSEDAICSNKLSAAERQRATSEDKKTDISETNPDTNPPNEQMLNETDSNIPITKQCDDKFMTKRNKLEHLLGSLKTKLGCAKIPLSNDNLSLINVKNDNLYDVGISKTKQINNPERPFNKIETKEIGNEKLLPNKNKDVKACDKVDNDVCSQRREPRTSESTEGDDPFSNLRDDELLNDLENMIIPIEHEQTDLCTIDSSSPSSSKSPFLDSGKDFHIRNPNLVQNIHKKISINTQANEKVKEMKYVKTRAVKHETTNTVKRNKDGNHKRNPNAMSKTSKSQSKDTSETPNLVSFKNFKSNTKIKFKKGHRNLISCGVDKPKTHVNVTEKKKRFKINPVNLKSRTLHGDKREYMTVYKIVSNDGSMSTVNVIDEKTSNAVNSSLTDDSTRKNKEQNTITTDYAKNRLDLFYKKFKKTYQKRLRKQDPDSQTETKVETEVDDDVIKTIGDQRKDQNNEKENNESTLCDSCDPIRANKAILVSNKNRVKYCLKCSCIFDTENCAYCVRKVKCDDETMSVPSSCEKESCCENSVENTQMKSDE